MHDPIATCDDPQRPRGRSAESESSQSAGRREELQRDVVRVSERKARPVRGVDDAAMGDPERLQLGLMLLEVRATATPERNVIEAWPQLVERRVAARCRVLMDAEQRRAEQPDDMMERAGVLVEHWFR